MQLAAFHLHGVISFFIVLVGMFVIAALLSPAVRRRLRPRTGNPGDSGVYEFRGGMNLEIPYYGARRVNATDGAVLRLSAAGLWLGAPKSGIPKDRGSVECRRDDVIEVFACKGWLTRGVGVAVRDGKTHYFWTAHSEDVLRAFGIAGYRRGLARRPTAVLSGQLPLLRRPRGRRSPTD